MKISMSLLKTVWLFAIVVLIMLGRGLPIWLLIVFTILALATPLVREFRKKTDLDERQVYISHFSSHISFYVVIGLLLFLMIQEYVKKGINPPPQWYLVLLVPLVIKFFINLFQNFGLRSGARGIGFFFAGIWLLFVLFSHGFQFETLIGSIPFLLMTAAAWFSERYPLYCGLGFIILTIVLLFFFGGWMKFDIYVRLLMYSLIPLPLLLSGIALLLSVFLKEER